MQTPKPPLLHITTAPQLHDFCRHLQGHDTIALDTEFIRDKSYYSKLCLIQIATVEQVACIDPLALTDLSELWDLLLDTSRLKILHAARQDLEIFFHLLDAIPQPIFDSQLAATVLGYGDQIGYADLVNKELGVTLEKGHARTDWQQRPLSEAQLNYAADDVRYLIRLYPHLRQRLAELHRLEWLQDDFDNLVDKRLYTVDVDTVWQRVAGHQRLKGQRLAVLQALARWREQQAQRRDKPRKWILGDDLLIALAQHPPKDVQQFKRLRNFPESVAQRHGEALLSLIHSALQLPAEQWPEKPLYRRLTTAQEAVVDVIMALVRVRASENAISPGLLTSRKELEKLVGGDQRINLLKGWRAVLAGDDVLALLEGRLTLRIEAQRLVTQESP